MVEDLINNHNRKISEEDLKLKIQLQRLKSKKFKKNLSKEIQDLNEDFCVQIYENSC
jgi:hypothetical protein